MVSRFSFSFLFLVLLVFCLFVFLFAAFLIHDIVPCHVFPGTRTLTGFPICARHVDKVLGGWRSRGRFLWCTLSCGTFRFTPHRLIHNWNLSV